MKKETQTRAYKIWTLERRRPPGEKETKEFYPDPLGHLYSLEQANRLLTIKNMCDKKQTNIGGIEYHTSFLIRKTKIMIPIQDVLPQFKASDGLVEAGALIKPETREECNTDTATREPPLVTDELEEPEEEEIEPEDLVKKYSTDPIIIIPDATDPHDPASITTI